MKSYKNKQEKIYYIYRLCHAPEVHVRNGIRPCASRGILLDEVAAVMQIVEGTCALRVHKLNESAVIHDTGGVTLSHG